MKTAHRLVQYLQQLGSMFARMRPAEMNQLRAQVGAYRQIARNEPLDAEIKWSLAAVNCTGNHNNSNNNNNNNNNDNNNFMPGLDGHEEAQRNKRSRLYIGGEQDELLEEISEAHEFYVRLQGIKAQRTELANRVNAAEASHLCSKAMVTRAHEQLKSAIAIFEQQLKYSQFLSEDLIRVQGELSAKDAEFSRVAMQAKSGSASSSGGAAAGTAAAAVAAPTADDRCCICLTAKRCVAVVPCGHMCYCTQCATIDQCPICRGKADSFLRIF